MPLSARNMPPPLLPYIAATRAARQSQQLTFDG
jgi:hypothetical protein